MARKKSKPFGFTLVTGNCPFCRKPLNPDDCVEGGHVKDGDIHILVRTHHGCQGKAEKAVREFTVWGVGCMGPWKPSHGLSAAVHHSHISDEDTLIRII